MDLIRFKFACFGIFANTIYSHHSLHIRFRIFVQIRIQIFDLMQNKYTVKQIFASEQIFNSELIFASTFSYTGEYSLQNIRFEANISMQANIRYVLLPII
jgi:hypothetical protein